MSATAEQRQQTKERQVKPERTFQKTCGCKTVGANEFSVNSAVWELCDYHKEKGQVTQ